MLLQSVIPPPPLSDAVPFGESEHEKMLVYLAEYILKKNQAFCLLSGKCNRARLGPQLSLQPLPSEVKACASPN